MKKLVALILFLISLGTSYAQGIVSKFLIDSLYSKYNDIAPVLSPEVDKLYFTKTNHPENVGGVNDLGDIWVSEKIGDKWMRAEPLSSPINNQNYSSLVGFADQGNTMYYLGDYERDGKIELYYSIKSGSDWTRPSKVKIPYFKNSSDHISAILDMSGKVLLMSVDSYASRGNEDIYVAFKKSINEFTELKNLGSTINTYAQELTPFLAHDGKTLFFASNGHEGKGSKDIFFSKRLDDSWEKWTNPTNLDVINTNGSDWYPYLTDDKQIYFVNVINSIGKGNLMMKTEDSLQIEERRKGEELAEEISVPESTSLDLSGEDNSDKRILRWVLKDSKTGQEALGDFILYKHEASTNEKYVIELEEQTTALQFAYDKSQVYSIQLSADGYFSEQLTFKADTIASDINDILLKKVEKGITVQLENVLFKRGTDELLQSSFSELENILNFLQQNGNVAIEIAGHTDNRGSPRLNIELSQDRANKVKDFLTENGIDEERLRSKGYGGVNPIASNASEESRKLNRRVEFTIIEID